MRGAVSSGAQAAHIPAQGERARVERRVLGERLSVAGACDQPCVQQIAPILESGNPLRFPVFFYPPVRAYINAEVAGVWTVDHLQAVARRA